MPSALFSPVALRGLTLANRVVVSPMCQYNSENGTANDWHLMHLGQFSLGAGALVMTEATKADFICLARGAMWDPRWAWHAAEELGAEAPYAPKTMPCHPSLRPQVFPQRQKPAA